MAVLLHHMIMTFPAGGEDRQQILKHGFDAPNAWLYLTPLRLGVNGPAAVLLFFVLSGFVLTMSLRSDRRPSFAAFAVSRFARIWLPFALAIFASAGLSSLLQMLPAPGTSGWFRFGTWHNPITVPNVLRHLLMTGTATDLDNPMWSLIHELRISLVFPLIAICTTRLPLPALISSSVLAIGCILLVGANFLPAHLISWVQTGTYLYFFVLGIIIAARVNRIKAALKRLPAAAIASLWLLALLALTVAPPDTSRVATLLNGALLLVSGAGAGLIIALAILGGLPDRMLLSPFARYLGRISYSLYLTHIIVLATVVHANAGRWPLPIIVTIAGCMALIVADLFQRLIEAPSQRLGKRIAEHVDRRRLRVQTAAA